MSKTQLHVLGLVMAIVFGAMLSPTAGAVSLLDPFNIPGTLDGGVVQSGRDIPYMDGPRGKLDIFAPQNAGGKAPVVVFIYGGGWNRGAKGDYPFVGHAFAAQGFVTVIPDYRLVPQVQYPEFVTDAARAIKWVEDNIASYGGDKNRIFLAGHSAGAYNAVMLGMDRSFLAQAGVTVPVRGVAALSGPYDFYPFEFGEIRDAFGNAGNPQLTQPVNLVTADAVPMFLATGTMDLIVKPANTQTLAKRLREAGMPVVENYYEGFGHMEPVMALSNVWRWRAPILDDIVGFFTDLGAFRDGAFESVDLLAQGGVPLVPSVKPTKPLE